MNWLGKLVQNEITPADTVVSLGCGILQEIMGLRCKSFLGIDIYEPYILRLQEQGINAICADITKFDFAKNKFDVVLALDILEHLEYPDAIKLINKTIKVANKKIIVYTPSKFFNNVDTDWRGNPKDVLEWMNSDVLSSYKNLGINKYQEHKCLITEKELQNFGFKTTIDNTDKNIYAVLEKE